MILLTDDVDESDFEDWTRNPMTVALMEILGENRELLVENILNLDPINDNHVDRKNAYLRGSKEMCEKVINITFDQLKEEEKSEENPETPYSW